ncbi:AzlC family ABC transporter permease [Nocardiopsis eucommiae]
MPRKSDLRSAFADSAPVGLALVPLGLAFGVLVVQAGLDWWWAGVSAALVYAGSFEFLLIGMVTAAAPLTAIAAAALMVNFRHVFYALSFPLDRIRGRAGRAYATFALTDEAYALTASERARAWTGRRVLYSQLFMHLYWTGSATVGALLGGLIPEGVQGLDFALTALFTVLALDALRDLRGEVSTPVLAFASALAAWVLFPDQMLLVAFSLFTAGLLAHRLVLRRKPAHV